MMKSGFLINCAFVVAYILLICFYTPTDAQNRETRSCADRKTPGLICESCDILATCIRLDENDWYSIVLEHCDNTLGLYCNIQEGGCSNKTGPCFFSNDGLSLFTCTSEGYFPDPYDCQIYHFCYAMTNVYVSRTIECGGDKAFNAATGDCSLRLSDPVCQQSQYSCSYVGQMTPWPSNPNFFYTCKGATTPDGTRIIIPEISRCPDGLYFSNNICSTQRPSGNSSSIPQTVQPGIGSSTTTIAPTTSKCTIVGLYPDPTSCHHYYGCKVVNAVPVRYVCPNGSYYSEPKKTCVRGTC